MIIFYSKEICKAQWLSWLERRPVTAEVVSSSLIWVVYGVLAQLGEHLPYKQRVIGSSPIVSTNGLVVQLVRTPPCHGGGRGFESHPGRHYADLAHLVERHLAKVEVASSSLVSRSTWGFSSAGRASALQAEGHRFEPCRSHISWVDSRVAKGGRL